MSSRVPTRCDGAAARLAGAQALRQAASALKSRRVRVADDRISITSWLYSRATALTREARALLAAGR